MPVGQDTIFVVKWNSGWVLKNKKEWRQYVLDSFFHAEEAPLVRFAVKNILREYPPELGQWEVFKFECGLSATSHTHLSLSDVPADSLRFASGKVLNKKEILQNQIAFWDKDFPTLNTTVYRSLAAARNDRQCVQILDLSGQGLTEIPADIDQFPFLKVLYLNDNEIRELPRALFKCRGLTTLHLHDNLIRKIPPQIARLQRLQNLDLGNNLIDFLPPELFELSRLTTLNLSKNPLSMYAFPEAIGQLKWLQTLNIAGISVDCFPAVMASLEFLETVIVSESCFALSSRECSEVLGQLPFTKVPD